MSSLTGISTSLSTSNAALVNGDTRMKLGDFAIDEYRPMKVVCIGAGFTGILAAIRLVQRVPNVEITIYDKEAGVGGTWFVNHYPGLACDVPSHTYQFSFEEKRDWSDFYAPGPEILGYLRSVVKKYGLMKYIHLQHNMKKATWDADAGKWNITLSRPHILRGTDEAGAPLPVADVVDATHEYEEIHDTADVLFVGTGHVHQWKWPTIEGLHTFEGRLLHPAQWDVSEGSWEEGVKDWGNKTVGVIGNGSSALQIVPSLQPRVTKVVNFVRSPTWISSTFSESKLYELLNRNPSDNDHQFRDADKERFQDDAFYKQFRHGLESDFNSRFPVSISGSDMQKAVADALRTRMLLRLEKKPEIASFLIPNFSVGCRRITPGPGYLEALLEDNVDFETTGIQRVTKKGIELNDGRHIALDVLVCATGFDTSYQVPYEIYGRDGQKLNDRWDPHPKAYLSMAFDGFPNMFLSLGPGSSISGSLVPSLEKKVDYMVAAVSKLQRERYKTIEVKPQAVQDFFEFAQSYLSKTVYGDNCRSWYKRPDGTITGVWPGSCLHLLRTVTHPRWEDYDYERLDDSHNRFYWLGSGFTLNEKTMTGDRAWYLDNVDIPPVPVVETEEISGIDRL